MRCQEILIVNAIVTAKSSNKPQAVLARLRGDTPKLSDGNDNPRFDGRTIKLPPSCFPDTPMAGEAWKAEFEDSNLADGGPRYRILRNAKLSLT